MRQQQCISQRPDTAGDRRYGAYNIFGRLEVHVAYQLLATPTIRHHVDADVHDDHARGEHVAGDEARLASRDDQDLGVAGMVAQVSSLGVEHRDRSVLTHEQQRRGLAHDIRPADNDHALAGDIDARALEDLDRGLSRCRKEAVVAERQQAGVAWMDAVDVLGRVYRVDHCAQWDVGRQRHLDDDPGDGRVGVEALYLFANGVRCRLRTDLHQPPVAAP